MSELLTPEEQIIEPQDAQVIEPQDTQTNDSMPLVEECAEAAPAPKKQLSKKTLIILGAALLAVIVLAFALLYKPKFVRVKNEAVQIAGMVSSGKNYFTIDTYPDVYENMDSTLRSLLLPGAQENALEAIKYANEELGFSGAVYSQMMKTNALMGRQTAENSKYKVSWTYHPDDGLEVTYEKK